MKLKELSMGQVFAFEFDGGSHARWVYKVVAVGERIRIREVKVPQTEHISNEIHNVSSIKDKDVCLRVV